MTNLRVLVTGSRSWPFPEIVWNALDAMTAGLVKGDGLTVVHGACPKGADQLAAEWCQGNAGHYDNQGIGVVEEPHPANWAIEGRRAGVLRNLRMVKLGADVCLAFIHNASRGATHCARAAESEGIETRMFEVKS